METAQLTWITTFIWGIEDDVTRDPYVRGKYRDVNLPMTVIHRLDAVLKFTKQAVLDRKALLDKAGIVHQDVALRQVTKQAFYNTSPFALRDLKGRTSRQQLEADFSAYLDGFSNLSNEAFPGHTFDFMLANPPYGKSWKSDLERMGGKQGIKDPRFFVRHRGEEVSLITRTSDGQMLFLVNMFSKMKHDAPLGSRIAEVHNGSSLFRGDAGQGESNIRRWIIENDWLEAIVALPLNMFYNTGTATYVWLLTNRKPKALRSLEEIRADLFAAEKEAEGVLEQILGGRY